LDDVVDTPSEVPLVLDPDGTLFNSNASHEGLLQIVRRVVGGIPSSAPDAEPEPDFTHWPVSADFVAWVKREAEAGRQIVLLSDDPRIAQKVAARFPFIGEVIAIDRASTKSLNERFPLGFLYAGGSALDVEAWRNARETVLVRPSRSVARKASTIRRPLKVFPRDPVTFTTIRRALRLHQWAKNALVFVPLLLGGKFFDPSAWASALMGFFAVSALASSTYLLNDLWDLAHDRRHWSKSARPLAAGQLSIADALLLAGTGVVAAFALIAWTGFAAIALLALYLVVSMIYSIRLKREPILDAFTLAGLFTIRLGIGVAVTGVRFSPWLFVFSMFVFLSLSLAKRCTEIARMAKRHESQAPVRGYETSDEPLVLAMGLAAMFSATLIMIIYLISEAFPAGFYAHPLFLWVFPAVLFMWLGRMWLLCHRGMLQDDPVAFALTDATSLVYGAVMIAAFIAAII
jgi:4-hydroxybenzoate polyprenyltransferase